MDVLDHITIVVSRSGGVSKPDGAPVHQTHRYLGLRHNGIHIGIGKAAGDIVKQYCSCLHCCLGGAGAHGVNGDHDAFLR